jgi:hypothetical protein
VSELDTFGKPLSALESGSAGRMMDSLSRFATAEGILSFIRDELGNPEVLKDPFVIKRIRRQLNQAIYLIETGREPARVEDFKQGFLPPIIEPIP